MKHQLLFTVFLTSLALPPFHAQAKTPDLVDGNLIMINPNGGWSWYQDERVIVDSTTGTLVVGSIANRFGFGGEPTDGNVEATLLDLESGARDISILREGLTSYGAGDDHNLPAFLKLADGDYLAMYAGHNNNNLTWYRTYDVDATKWGEEHAFDWDTIPGGTNFPVTYSNVFFLADEGTIYNFARTRDRSPNLILSTDGGDTWKYGGQLTEAADVGYVNGYFKYAGNGKDRIDFVATEHHPRDFNNSLYHGYIQDGASYDSHGNLVDSDIADLTSIPSPDEFTPVFAADTVVEGMTMTRGWNIDLVSYSDGTIATLFKARANDDDTEHHFFYARFDGERWQWTRLGHAGPKLFPREEDYTGLGALDPNDPDVLYISTPIDPSSHASLGNHEIFKGVTDDNGQTWTWSAITENSTYDNVRPVIPAWDEENTAIIWLRGSMTSSQNYDFAVVGLLEREAEEVGPLHYLDASLENTTAAEPDATNASEESRSLNGWSFRTDVGNGGNLFASEETEGTDAASTTLRTRTTGLEAGTYDVWAFFWATSDEDWRIDAGLQQERTHTYRLRGSQTVDSDSPTAPELRQIDGGKHLYQAWLGRVTIEANESVEVFVRPSLGGKTDGSERTWYDGVGYAPVRRN